jgi:hypothetical protein
LLAALGVGALLHGGRMPSALALLEAPVCAVAIGIDGTV